jgi:alanyl-tRNA synthetase
MTCNEIREAFLKFFREKQHEIVSSSPLVIKNDPTLMFTNAGMNQFKDIFLGNAPAKHPRIANTQKCLRVSGKHNDLEEVGLDTYHHTMFEMLGNWSFGDYFKKDAIDWAYEFLTQNMKIPSDRLYATIFEGSADENLDLDQEAYDFWKNHLPEDRILRGSKKDNFWEMGETGPCGPCSEIHVDLRDEKERKKKAGSELVNKNHHLVIEIWNLVFIQYNRKSNGLLEPLPDKHVDTGMGFERLCMAVQNKHSNYDTDVFQPIIIRISELSGKKYGLHESVDIAMRVIADHLRAVSFSIADGQIPSNNKAGYVIRRILRRAIRYSYTYLEQSEPFICKLVPELVVNMGKAFPEIAAQQKLIEKVIEEEENSFLKTLETGIRLLEQTVEKCKKDNKKEIDGKSAFLLYDTYGFPLDLTELILRENNLTLNHKEFEKEMEMQKSRSRNAAKVDTGDWVVLHENVTPEFVGYDFTEIETRIVRYRRVFSKGQEYYQLVLEKTPFYAESGGQIGDTGILENGAEKIPVFNTIKENDLNVHLTKSLPQNPGDTFRVVVDDGKRKLTANNHSATHLLHEALRNVLGSHVEQKGSLVHYDYLRFDFSHFSKLSEEEISTIEAIVNQKIRENIRRDEHRELPIAEAKKQGAISLFGEKYGDLVRTIRFGSSIELCGGIHVETTGNIGLFKITSESAIAAGIRRIEAITGPAAEKFVNEQIETLREIRHLLKDTSEPVRSIQNLLEEKNKLEKQLEAVRKEQAKALKDKLSNQVEKIGSIQLIADVVVAENVEMLKDLAYQLKNEISNLFLVLGAKSQGKAFLCVAVSENLITEKGLKANEIIKTISPYIQGGGGGQDFLATAGGKNPDGIEKAISAALEIIAKS